MDKMERLRRILCHSPHWRYSVVIITVAIVSSRVSFTYGQSCEPKNCITSQWTEWSACSESCGDSGVRARTRRILAAEICGGTCEGGVFQSEPCNIRCCAQNCGYTPWSAWGSCRCDDRYCDEAGSRIVCFRWRDKLRDAVCGGYCDEMTYEPSCGKPCCYKDCIMGSWGPWGECDARCESEGLRHRERIVIQEPDCGGKRCNFETDAQPCTGPCCPQDCVLGPWSEWSECPAVCGEKVVTRTRFVQQPICGGANCPENDSTQNKTCEKYINVDCKMGPWSEWSQCTLNNGFCGEGTKRRERTVLVEAKCQGEPCSNTTETAVCYGPCCKTDCEVGEWTDFGHCSTQCGEGMRNRTREIVIEPDCGGSPCPDVTEFTPCTVQDPTDCKFAEWSEWSACSTDCGKGVSIRTRSLITPAYCGGKCSDSQEEEERECESYAARADCQVGPWSEWDACVRDCAQGLQKSTRVITVVESCGGTPCTGKYNLTQTRTCHEKCSQLCNQGQCSCNPGYDLDEDGYTCKKKDCGKVPKISYCGPGTRIIVSCRAVRFNCESSLFGDSCHGVCSRGWVVKGENKYIECQEDGTWTEPRLFCGPQNRAPLDIHINSTEVSELLHIDHCFAKLTTVVDNEAWDKHSYSVVGDPSGTLKTVDDLLCIKKQLDFESSEYREWSASIRSTDLDGLHVDKSFTFTLLNNNDPPRSAKLVPNKIPENSLKGTEVGCFETVDDDPGQRLKVFMLTNSKIFELYTKEEEYCLRVRAESEPDCQKLGGKLCVLNYETQKELYIAIMVQDDAPTPLSSYFDIGVVLTDVNEPIIGVTFSPQNVPENVPAGKPLVQLVAEDEDENDVHTFEIVDNPSGLFQVKNNTLVSTVILDYEEDPDIKYSVKIKATDVGPPLSSVETVVTFGITDINEPPYTLQLTSTNALLSYPSNQPRVRENMPAVIVGTVSVYDPDRGDNVQLSVSDSTFRIINTRCSTLQGGRYNYCSGRLVHFSGFNYEESPVVSLKITATDTFSHETEINVNITVIDMDDPPSDILINGEVTDIIRVPENSKDFQAAEIEAVDEDEGDTHSYFLSGPASSQFRLEGNVLLTTSVFSLDYEDSEPSQLIITAVDTGQSGLTVAKTFNIKITDVNEAPSTIIFSSTKVTENSEEGTMVAELSAMDPDNAIGTGNRTQQTFTYTLLESAQDRFYLQENKLLVKKSSQNCGQKTCTLDYEGQRDLLVKVRVTDSGQPPMSKEVSEIISILDANDPPYGIQVSSSQIRENKVEGSVVGSLSASDQDKDSMLTFTLLNHTNEFDLLKGIYLVQLSVLDYETQREYYVKIEVKDNGTPVKSFIDTIKIEVMNVNEPPKYTGPELLLVAENTEIGTTVGIITILDPDREDSVDILPKNFQDSFVIVGKTISQVDGGTLITANLTTGIIVDYELKSEYNIELCAVDKQGLETVQYIKLQVEDKNDPPEDILLDGLSSPVIKVDEGTAASLSVLSAADQDREQTHSFRIVSQPSSNFIIANNELMLSESLDYETNSTVSLTLEVSDDGNPSYTMEKVISVEVQNVNEPPTALELTPHQVAENSVADTEVGVLTPTDPDNTEGFEFSLLDDAGGKFKIEGDKLLVVSPDQCTDSEQTQCSLNYEQQPSLAVKIMVTDNGFPRESATFDLQIGVIDTNDAPYDIILSNNEVEELASAGTAIGELSVSDEDSLQTHTFTLTEDGGNAFRVDNGRTLVKTTGDRLDISKVYSVTVVATDSGGPPKSTERTFYISIAGVSEAPQNLQLKAKGSAVQVDSAIISVPENCPVNDEIATITAEDSDVDNTISFSLLVDEDGQFQVAENVECNQQGGKVVCSTSLLLAKPLDFEMKDKCTIISVAVDSDDQQASKTVEIQISDVAEAPTDIVFSKPSLSIAENSYGTFIGRFTAVDPDIKDSHSYILSENPDGVFVLSSTGQLSVTPDAVIDYESKSTFEITVVIADSAQHSFSKTFSGNVVNVNEKPSNVTLSSHKISEGSLAATVIGQLVTEDPDNINVDPSSGNRQTFEYKILDGASGRFELDQSNLRLSLKGAECSEIWCGLNFESEQSHEIQIQVVDSGTPRLTASFALMIEVVDENDPPVVSLSAITQLREDMKIGDVVTELSATDEDSGQSIVFSVEGKDSDKFKIEGNRLILASLLDFEDKPAVSVDIVVTDDGSPPKSGSATFEFEVLNVDEAPSSVTLKSVRGSQSPSFEVNQPVIGEHTKLGALIGQLVIIDPDNDEDITVVISGNALKAENPGCLTLTKGTRCVASVVLIREVDYEEQSSFSAVVSVIDKSGLQVDQTFTVQVKDENDPPVSILINNQNVDTVKVKESTKGITIATLSTVDSDQGQTFTYSSSGSSMFYLVGNELKVTTAANIDYESVKEILIRLKVTDSGQPPLSLEKEVTIEVLDENEAPANVILTRNKVSEDALAETEIGSFMTTDPDNKKEIHQTFTYELTQNANGIFKVINGNLMINEAKLDYEVQPVHTIRVKVTDSGNPPLSTEFDLNVEVINQNDPPADLQLSALTISEGAEVNSEVGILSAQDPDSGQTISFTISDSDVFTVKDSAMVVSGTLDFETSPRVNVEVTATDDGTPAKSVVRSFTITVTDINEAPVNMEFTPSLSATFEIPEKTKVNTVIGIAESIDPDNIDRIEMVVATVSRKYFKMDSAGAICKSKVIATLGSTFTVCSQNVLLAEQLKYQAGSPPVVLEITGKDKGQLSYSNQWEFIVLDSNDAPYDIEIDAEKLEIPENEADFKVGALECLDPDQGQRHAFQIVTSWRIFRVEQGSVLALTEALDAEEQPMYDVTIRCIDDGIPEASFTKTFSIQVKDVNEAPSDITLSSNEVPMTAQDGETVALILVADPDNAGSNREKQKHACVIAKDDSNSFKINKEGSALQINGQVPVEKVSVMITLNCSDNGVPSYSFIKDFMLFITETADVPKAVVLNGNKTVAENSENVEVGTLKIVNELTETEIQGNFIFYDVKTAEIESEVFAVEGNMLKIISLVDFETFPTLTVSVSASGVDLQGNFFELTETFKIKVVDLNEPPQQISIYGGGVIPENSQLGTIIGDLNTLDPEPYQTYTYTLISVAIGLDASQSSPELLNAFAIDGRTLKIGSNSTILDYETAPTLSLVVQTVDSGSPPLGLNYTVRIVLTDANDAPTDIFLSNSLIPENSGIGDLVGQLSVTDPDTDQEHKCVINNLDAVPFTVQDSLYLRVSQLGLDYEKQRIYVIEVTCQDEGKDGTHLKMTKALMVNVTNVNEPPYDITLSTSEIEEANVIGQLVGEISATDPDSGQVLISLAEGSSVFEIRGNGSLTATSIFDFESQSTQIVKVKATDDEGLFSTRTFTIQIKDKNEKPTNITLGNNIVSESAQKGTFIGILRTEDPDNGQTFMYTLSEILPADGHFVINGDKLEVGESDLDHEHTNVYRISVKSTDSGNPPESLIMEFDIIVTDANEPPTEIYLAEPLSVEENLNQSVVLSNVTVVDEESKQAHSCHIMEDNVPFIIVTNLDGTIQLIVNEQVSYEKASNYDITLRCSDGEFDIEKKFNVKVKDVNEPPTSISLDGPNALPAVSSGRYEVGRLQVQDDDKGQTHTFRTSGSNSDLLKVEGDNILCLVRPIPKELLDRPDPSIDIIIVVADSGQPVITYRQSFTLPITGVDLEALKLPEITIDNSKISEDAVAGDVVGQLYDLNTTVSDHVIFSIPEDPSNLFIVKDNKYLILSRNISTFFGNSAGVTIQAIHQQTQETKSRTIIVIIIRSDKCYDNGASCHEDARCVQVNETSHQCQCNEDFQGDGYLCEQIDDCESQGGNEQCVHGTCTDDIASFVCQCDEGYMGELCEIPPSLADPCQGHSCKNEAACKATNDGVDYICVCGPGWTGERCETSIDDCLAEPCLGGGTCVDGHMSYSCSCPDERTGHKCQFFTYSCQAINCDSAFICVPKFNKNDQICSPEDRVVELKIKCLDVSRRECGIKFLMFVESNGRLPAQAMSLESATARKKREVHELLHFINTFGTYMPHLNNKHFSPELRVKRQANSTNESQATAYSVNIEEAEDGTLIVKFVLMDSTSVPFTREQVLAALAETCDSIGESKQVESSFCPSIEEAYTEYKESQHKPDDTEEETGTPVAAIAGAAGGVVVVIIVVVVVVLVVRKQQNQKKDINTDVGREGQMDYDQPRAAEPGADYNQ